MLKSPILPPLPAVIVPAPFFGDIGEGTIGEDGFCYVPIDPILAETVTLNQYQVFLQKYGAGDCWIQERKPGFFIVQGTPGLSFGWELKAKQADFDQLRMEKQDIYYTPPATDLGVEAASYIENLREGRINAA